MRFAYVNNEKREAEPKLRGVCPVCGEEVIAKCGTEKINHWAHKANSRCDKWWESETNWHRMWKDYFPKDWQEIVMHDDLTGEKHIADVHTLFGISIEFQHSRIKEEERISRESFYKNLIWVVDGTRLPRDVERFKNASSYNIIPIQKTPFAYTMAPEKCFPKNWLNSEVPVFFDFLAENKEHNLFCLMPGRAGGKALVYIVKKTEFLSILHKGKIFDTDPKEFVAVFQNELERIEKVKVQRVPVIRTIRRSKRL